MRQKLIDRVYLYDGSKGFLLMQEGLKSGECPDLWNLERKDTVYNIHRAYVDAGSDIIQTNTLQASRPHLEIRGLYGQLPQINREGVRLARKAASGKALVAASIGPTGCLMRPLGPLKVSEAEEIFAEQIRAILEAEPDILHFETFISLAELRAAVLAAKALTDLPLIATLAFEKNARTVMGDEMNACITILEALGVDCAGANCSLSPDDMLEIFTKLPEDRLKAQFPLCSKPNAGIPTVLNGETCYGATVQEYCDTIEGFVRAGVRLVGGCCGSAPEHIAAMRLIVDDWNLKEKSGGITGVDRYGATCSDPLRRSQAASVRLANAHAVFDLVLEKTEDLRPDLEIPIPPHNPTDSSDQCETIDAEEIEELAAALLSEAADAESAYCLIRLLNTQTGTTLKSDADQNHAGAVVSGAVGAGRTGHDATDSDWGYSDTVTFIKAIAENAAAQVRKPVVFSLEGESPMGLPSASVLEHALRNYCGTAGVLFSKMCPTDSRQKEDILQIMRTYGAREIILP